MDAVLRIEQGVEGIAQEIGIKADYSNCVRIVAIKLIQYHASRLGFSISASTWKDASLFGSQDLNNYMAQLEAFHLKVILGHPFTFSGDDLLNDVVGQYLQDKLDKEQRKRLGVNYTEAPDLIYSYIQLKTDYKSIADPFCGSGNLIIAYLHRCTTLPQRIMINDIMPAAVLLAYVKVSTIYSGEIDAYVGNGFDLTGEYDLILMNPPFTRTLYFDKETRSKFRHLEKYLDENPKRAGLHFWSVLQAYSLLRQGGDLVAILPAAILYSSYSHLMRNFLLKSFNQVKFFTEDNKRAHSYGSYIKEIILYAQSSGPREVRFTIQRDNTARTRIMEPEEAKDTWNWWEFLGRKDLQDMYNKIPKAIELFTLKDLGTEIIRGIELYGPDIFFFPNKKTKILAYNPLTIQYKDEEYIIPDQNWTYILRQPKPYKHHISPTIQEVALVVDKPENEDLANYLRAIEPEASIPRNKFGKDWFRHTYLQLKSGKRKGHLFFVDKLDLTSAGSLIHYSDSKLPCTKNFYVAYSLSQEDAKLMAAWMSSSFYLIIYLIKRREIGGTYGRFQIVDYSKHKLMPDIFKLQTADKKLILRHFDKLRKFTLPPLVDPQNIARRRSLDTAWMDVLGIELDLDDLYRTIDQTVTELISRNRIKAKKTG